MSVFLRKQLINIPIVLGIISLSSFVILLPVLGQKKVPILDGCFIRTSNGRIITLPNCGSQPQPSRTENLPQTKPQASQTQPTLQNIRNEPLFYTSTGQTRFWDFIEGTSKGSNLYVSEDKYFKIEYSLSTNIRNAVVNGSINCGENNQISLGFGTAYNSQSLPVDRSFSVNETFTVSPVSIAKYCPSSKILLKK